MQNQLTSITLTNNQKQLLVRMQMAPTPLLAGKEVRNGQQSMEAARVLIDLGLIEYGDEKANVTDLGKQQMRDENLIDQSDQLTPYGDQVKNSQTAGTQTAPPPESQEPSASPSPSAPTDSADNTWESFDLLRTLNNSIITD